VNAVQLRQERQNNPVADEFSALVAVTRPILAGLLHSVAAEQLEPHGGPTGIKLKALGRVRKANDGDLGVAFEYAIHDAVVSGEPVVTERVVDALKLCRINQGDPASILFAIEKEGAKQLVDTKRELITPESRVLSGKRGQPVKLQRYMNQIAAAFRRKGTNLALPQSIRGLWKADLFLGSPEREHWVGTTIKIAPRRLEAAAGLRIAIVPAGSQRSDSVVLDDQKQLVVCPIPHDYSFMQTFHEGMRIMQVLCANDFNAAKPPELPNPQHREVARAYAERRDFTVLEVLDAMGLFAQPHLLQASEEQLPSNSFDSLTNATTNTMIGPIPRADVSK
jgi:hypothetical protein